MTKPHYPTLTNARLTSGFGWRIHPVTRRQSTHHDGIDLAPARAGTTGVPVYAVADGIVRNREYNKISGNRIYVEHTQDSYTSVYCHLASFNVKLGQRVKRGQLIGRMGSTGASTGIHLHFGVSKSYPVRWSTTGTSNGSFINPVSYLNKSFPSSGVSKSTSTSKWTKVTGKWTGQSLFKGQCGQPVGEMQRALANNKPPFYPNKGAKNNGIDEYFGSETEEQVRRFQKYYKLKVDGIPGKEVYNQVNKNKSSKKKSTIALPNATYYVKMPRFNGSGVRKVQEALASVHFYPNKGAKNNGIDGYYGPKTADAVKRFQSVHGLKSDGVYGPKTKKALEKAMK